MKENCVFCREMRGSRNTNFASRYPEIKSRFLLQTDSFIAFPCIGQLTEGHFLVIPKRHYPTFRDVHLEKNNSLDEMQSLVGKVHAKLGFELKDSLFFEHGANDSGSGGCGIYHAHIHVVPNAADVVLKEVFDFKAKKSHEDIIGALSSIPENQSYVMSGNYKDGYFSIAVKDKLPSQTLRRNAAKAMGLQNWDWRNSSRETSLLSFLRKAS